MISGKGNPNDLHFLNRVSALYSNEAGVPTVVWLFINDTEEHIRGLLKYCIEAQVYGIVCFGMSMTLREGNREYFYN